MGVIKIEKRILSSYQLLIYEDGYIEIKPMELLKLPPVDHEKCSSRIKQALLVLSLMQIYIENGENLENAFIKATISVAHDFGTTRQSILDKVTRQMDLKASEFREKARKYFDYKDSELKNILLKHIGAYSREADEIAINNFFNTPV